MSKVFVIDTNKQPLNPLHPGRARLLLKQGKAAVYRRYPFTLILKRDMDKRRAVRKSRRQRKTRYRKPRFDNRGKLGSNRVSNLVAACKPCNQRKGNQDIRDFLKEQPQRLARILAQTKAHWCDAACVGRSTPEPLVIKHVVPLHITATGHGSRQMCRMNEYGFPRTKPKGARRVKGFQTGDLVRAVVTSGANQGTYVGKVAVRTRGVFNIKTVQGTVTDIHHRFCTLIVRSDGYSYHSKRKEAALSPAA